MANSIFDEARAGWLRSEVGWTVPTIHVALVRGYTFNASHRHVSDVQANGGILHATATLTGKTGDLGVADAGDVTFTTPAAFDDYHYLLIYQASAVTGGGLVAVGSQRNIAWIDTAAGLPVRPNGASITVKWDDGVNKIFRA